MDVDNLSKFIENFSLGSSDDTSMISRFFCTYVQIHKQLLLKIDIVNIDDFEESINTCTCRCSFLESDSHRS